MGVDYYSAKRLTDSVYDSAVLYLQDQHREIHLNKKSLLIGRDKGCDICFVKNTISRRHARLQFDSDSGSWLIEDLSSVNGTVVDGKAAEPYKPVRLHEGSVIEFAGAERCSFLTGRGDPLPEPAIETTILREEQTGCGAGVSAGQQKERVNQNSAGWRNPYYETPSRNTWFGSAAPFEPTVRQNAYGDVPQNFYAPVQPIRKAASGRSQTAVRIIIAAAALLLCAAIILASGYKKYDFSTKQGNYTIKYSTFFGKITSAAVVDQQYWDSTQVDLSGDGRSIRSAEFRIPGGGNKKTQFEGNEPVSETERDSAGKLVRTCEYDSEADEFTVRLFSDGNETEMYRYRSDGTLLSSRTETEEGYVCTTYFENGGYRSEWYARAYLLQRQECIGGGTFVSTFDQSGRQLSFCELLDQAELAYEQKQQISGTEANIYVPAEAPMACTAFDLSYKRQGEHDIISEQKIYVQTAEGLWLEKCTFQIPGNDTITLHISFDTPTEIKAIAITCIPGEEYEEYAAMTNVCLPK